MPPWHPTLGAIALPGDRCHFRVWAPKCKSVAVRLLDRTGQLLPLEPRDGGYFEIFANDVPPGTRYLYCLDNRRERPDPVSRHQAEGVHGPSTIVDRAFAWTDTDWRGLPFADLILYELHVGTYTADGSFDAIIPHLDGLADLGINALELLPLAQTPGVRNWGYDGVYLFAPRDDYGGPAGLKRLVDAAHARGMAVLQDVVYNHLGPEGNYLRDFGHYFTERHHTPWGSAINVAYDHSDAVRAFFLENAQMWQHEYHLDGLRLDAVQEIPDGTARSFLAELADTVQGQERPFHLIAETSANDIRNVRPTSACGFGMDAVWNDDFHHSLRALLTPDRNGYYQDFGSVALHARAWREGFSFQGEFYAYRGRRHGSPTTGLDASHFVIYNQNHDQVGNRARSNRLIVEAGFAAAKVAAASMLLSPYVPMLFMGEEFAETAPFPFFVDHGDPHLIDATRRGRAAEYAEFLQPHEMPDPQDAATFASAKLSHDRGSPEMLRFYRDLIRLRRTLPALRAPRENMDSLVEEAAKRLTIRRWSAKDEVWLVFGFSPSPSAVEPPMGQWRVLLDSAAPEYGDPGAGQRVLVFGRPE